MALICAAGALLWTLYFKPASASQAAQQVVAVTGLSLPADSIRHLDGTGQVVIVEFSDFQCPFCRQFARDTFPRIKRELIDSGMARFAALHYPIETLHPLALQAAEAAECAGRQGRYWEMSDQLLTDAMTLERDDLLRRGLELKLDRAGFEACLDTQAARAVVRKDAEQGARLNVTGTPAFFVGTMRPDGGITLIKRIQGAASFDVIAREVAAVAEDL